MVMQDRAKATAWVQAFPDPELRNRSYSGLAAQLAITDPKSAASWLSTLPQDAMAGAADIVASMWAQADPAAAGQWVGGLSGGMRDSAVSSYSSTIAETDPAAAMAWAVTVSDLTKRQSATRQAMRQWLARDTAAARSWLQSSSLGEEEKARLLATPTLAP
jgi:hypothetical protein